MKFLFSFTYFKNTNAEMMTSFNPTMDFGTSGTFQDIESDALPQLLKSLDCVVPQSHQADPQLQHGNSPQQLVSVV